MGLVYALLFATTGVTLPFAGLWFESRGLSGAAIGAILATPMLARLVTGPMLAVWADGFKRRRTPIAILSGVAGLGYGACLLVEGYALWLPLWFVAATAAAAIIPLTDVLTLRLARREGFTFAIPRSVGSAAFVVANMAMGLILLRATTDAILLWVAAACALATLAVLALAPQEPVAEGGPSAPRDRFAGLGRLLADPVFMTAIFAVGAVQASHAFLYGFSAIEWQGRGIPAPTVGLLWAFSVMAEIAFMWWLEPWRRRRGIGPWPLLMLAAGAGVVRWTALAFAPPLWMLWPLQALHALTFAAAFLAGLQIVERLSPPDSQTAAQTLSSALSSGVLIGLATMLSGPLYDAYGARGYLAMTVLALIALATALNTALRRAA
jgi:PPP family 3-phenylpropionic acid transporter